MDFAEVVIQAVSTSQVLLAVIGPHWLTATNEDGQRRLDDPDDTIRLAIATALERNLRVIPILVEGAVMPRRQELPENLAGLARRKALIVRHETFSDIDRLVAAIESILYPRPVASAPSVPAPPGPRSVPPRPRPVKPVRRPKRQQRESEDEVSFTAGYPGVVTPQLWYSLSVFVHLGRLQAEVDQHIASESQQFGLRPAVSKVAAHVPLPKGTQLRVSPDIPDVVFNPPTQEVRWLEDLQQVAFRLQATSEAAGQTVLGAVEIHAGPLLVGQVPLSIRIRSPRERQERAEVMAASKARLFGSVFASYAHKDDHVVRAFAEAYQALGIDVLVDKASLRAGQDWQRTLRRLIEEADLFQLFWSEAASRSRYVTQEWQHALLLQDRKGERFIRPLYWTIPWPPPPVQLANLHFASLDLAALSNITGRSGPRARPLRRR